MYRPDANCQIPARVHPEQEVAPGIVDLDEAGRINHAWLKVVAQANFVRKLDFKLGLVPCKLAHHRCSREGHVEILVNRFHQICSFANDFTFSVSKMAENLHLTNLQR
uniref:(northern house mosquito) hypothetical protein n=1 Tax=Culex pipiens TaxID=7175 RepID=A0A8D8G8J9_CULPI